MLRLVSLAIALLLASCATEQPKYPPDSQSLGAPRDQAAIVNIPKYPAIGRVFAIQQTPGSGDTLKVVDQHGTLEILQGAQRITSITLGPCLSFSRMNDQHDFGAQGKPEYTTAPPDCRVWNGRHWNESFKTQTSYYRNPCLYEGRYTASVKSTSGGDKVVETEGEVEGIILDTGAKFQFRTHTTYDDALKFFRTFSVGFVGTIRVLKELK